ncbi:hypothetical protein IAG44_19415 [Streptomyces roseirectus]|uniref:Lipoprotein n=1 Tax=Streptomyces roseirectus TaxID=2768066 RepID=A0A7H0IF21_9ACTN|nr:hypothetical protein [Streptomyces roseirectus]QNP71387.1 hypothetical protein IAG44_19415 [Streptomyces roseirectus]
MTRAKTWGTAVSAAVLALAGCGAEGASQPGGQPAASGVPAAVEPAGNKHTAVVGVPSLGGGEALVSGAARKGSAEYPIPGGLRAGGMLAVAFECEGAGKLVVDVVPAGASFSVPCEKGKVAPLMNVIEVDRTDPAGMLRFTAGSGVTWAFAAGWDNSSRERAS